MSPAQLAWVLNQIEFGDDAQLPNNISVDELRDYLGDLINRLKKFAFPLKENE